MGFWKKARHQAASAAAAKRARNAARRYTDGYRIVLYRWRDESGVILLYPPWGVPTVVRQFTGLHQLYPDTFRSYDWWVGEGRNMKKPQPLNGTDALGNPAVAKSDADYVTLCEYLTHRTYEDGSRRELATVSISYSDGAFKGCLRDKDMGRCLWVSSKTICDLLYALEQAAGDDAAEWREDRYAAENKTGTAKRK